MSGSMFNPTSCKIGMRVSPNLLNASSDSHGRFSICSERAPPTSTRRQTPQGEPIDIGRKTKVWTTGQRWAIIVRDHGRCRWPNCWRRTCDVHHVIWLDEQGGITAVCNGCLLCPHHHTYVHEGGFRITGEPNGTLKFWRADGELIDEA